LPKKPVYSFTQKALCYGIFPLKHEKCLTETSRDATSSFFIAFTPSTVRLFKQSYAIIFAAENKKKGIGARDAPNRHCVAGMKPEMPGVCRTTEKQKTRQLPPGENRAFCDYYLIEFSAIRTALL